MIDIKSLIIAQNALILLEDILFVIFIFAMYYKPEGGLARFSKAIWFVPGILSVLQSMLTFINVSGLFSFGMGAGQTAAFISNIISICLGTVLGTATLLLLGWWITHPFKKLNPIAPQNYAPYSPAPNPAAQPATAYCPACGAPLMPDKAFCSKCGTDLRGN